MRIKVTAKDIANGKPNACFSCPIALALNRIGQRWVVMGGYLLTWEEREPIEVVLPRDARDFINDFDRGRPVAPFSFDIDLPTE